MTDEQMALVAQALAHPARVRILRLLADQTECRGAEVFSELPLAQSTVSEHLRVLKEAGLVTSHPVGNEHGLLHRARREFGGLRGRRGRAGGCRRLFPGPGLIAPSATRSRRTNDERSSVTDHTEKRRMGFFERYLTLWVVLCIAAGTAHRQLRGPAWRRGCRRFTYAQISIPVAVLIWLMIYPMMLQIDFASLRRVGEKKQGLIVTTVVELAHQAVHDVCDRVVLPQRRLHAVDPGPTRAASTSPERCCSARRPARRWCSSGRTSPTATRPTRSCRSR